MTIEEYARKRDDLRADLCGKLLGTKDFIAHERTLNRERIALDGILEAVDRYEASVAALDAEFKGEKV